MANYYNDNRVLFNGAALVIDIQVAGDTAVRTSYRTGAANDSGKLVRDKKQVDERIPLQLRITDMVTHVMAQLRQAKYSGTVVLMVQDAAFLKMLQLVGLRGKKDSASELMCQWMWDTDFYQEYRDKFKALADEYRKTLNAGIRVMFKNSRELYLYKLNGDFSSLKNGDIIALKNSVNEEMGIAVDDRVTLNGTFKVKVDDSNPRFVKAFVWRNAPRIRDDGTGMSDADEELRVYRMIHDETRRQLPRRVNVVTEVKVIDSVNF
jgi:flagellar motor switch/type III secretory pathway protein FliN